MQTAVAVLFSCNIDTPETPRTPDPHSDHALPAGQWAQEHSSTKQHNGKASLSNLQQAATVVMDSCTTPLQVAQPFCTTEPPTGKDTYEMLSVYSGGIWSSPRQAYTNRVGA
jgi:hypothetical protein